MSSDLAVDQITGDLVVEAFDLKIERSLEAIAQELRLRLRFFLGEWYLDRTFGVPYYQTVFQKPADAAILDSVFKDAILATPGVVRLETFSIDFDGPSRLLSVQFRAVTDTGEAVEIEETLP